MPRNRKHFRNASTHLGLGEGPHREGGVEVAQAAREPDRRELPRAVHGVRAARGEALRETELLHLARPGRVLRKAAPSGGSTKH